MRLQLYIIYKNEFGNDIKKTVNEPIFETFLQIIVNFKGIAKNYENLFEFNTFINKLRDTLRRYSIFFKFL